MNDLWVIKGGAISYIWLYLLFYPLQSMATLIVATVGTVTPMEITPVGQREVRRRRMVPHLTILLHLNKNGLVAICHIIGKRVHQLFGEFGRHSDDTFIALNILIYFKGDCLIMAPNTLADGTRYWETVVVEGFRSPPKLWTAQSDSAAEVRLWLLARLSSYHNRISCPLPRQLTST